MIILLVEDDVVLRNHLTLLLRRANYTVVEATSAAEAIQLCNFDLDIDLVLVDEAVQLFGSGELPQQMQSRWPGLKVLHIRKADEQGGQGTAIRVGGSAREMPAADEVLLHTVRQIL